MDAIEVDANNVAIDNRFSDFLVQTLVWNWNYLERGLFPLENDQVMATLEKVGWYALQVFTNVIPGVILLAATVPLAAIGLAFRQIEPFIFTGEIKNLPGVGASTAEYQVNGATTNPNSTWRRWEDQHNLKPEQRSGLAVDHWNNMDAVIDRLKELGMKDYRFSVEWSKIEPVQGHYDQLAIQHYVTFCDKLKAAGIEPLVTLHHFSLPIWFADLGEFEKEENIALFVDFSEMIFRALTPHGAKYWSTINEPGIFTSVGYGGLGDFPPCKNDVALSGLVLKHLMMAHCQIYDRLKPLDPESCIGVSHNILRMQPYHPFNPVEQLACHYVTRMTHDVIMNFLKTGEYRYQMPCVANYTYSQPDIQEKFDAVFIQYYSDPLVSMEFSAEVMVSTCYPNQKMTNMDYRFYPEGLATALEECRSFKKPIFITETGVDGRTEEDRVEFFQKIFEVVSRSIESGIDVQKLFVWSLEDNYEWAEGWEKHFGLHSFDHITGKFALRDVGRWIQELNQRQPQRAIA